MYFEYCDSNDIIKNKAGRIVFSNYFQNKDEGMPECPVPFNMNLQNRFKPENTIELGLDGNLYDIEYYHSGYVLDINCL